MACACNIDDIARECGKNAGGVKPTLYITCEDELTAIGSATDHAVSTITVRAYDAGPPEVTKGYFRTWNASRRDADFKSVQNEESGQWETEFTYFIPKQSSAKAAVLNNLGEDNNIAIVTDQNGAKRLVGELGNPCNVIVEESTVPKNGYKVTGKWTSGYSPYFFTGTVDVSPT